jgi:A/G-specific adenine glycosylase
MDWYRAERRELPWRRTHDPYLIWVSEIILQQTRVDQGLEYFIRFTECFPDVFTLAKAREQDVLKIWQGLGYYSRARNLHAAAKQVVKVHQGVFPEEYHEVIRLKGIGPYTVAAILSIAFAQPWPVIDGNVIRVVSRLLSLSVPADKPAGRKAISALLEKEICRKDPGTFNQAMMELGALICSPTAPVCEKCPLHACCTAYRSGNVAGFPVRSQKTQVSPRYFNYIIITESGKEVTYIRKRTENDIWKNLYDFPMIESGKVMKAAELKKTKEWEALFSGCMAELMFSSGVEQHRLTHRLLHIRFFYVKIDGKMPSLKGVKRIRWNRADQYPMPMPVSGYLNKTAIRILRRYP